MGQLSDHHGLLISSKTGGEGCSDWLSLTETGGEGCSDWLTVTDWIGGVF